MSTLPEGITQEDLRRLVKLRTQMARAKAAEEILSNKIKDAHEAKAGTYTYDEFVVEITVPDVLDEAKLLKQRPQENFPQLYKTVPDTKKIQADSGKKFYIVGGGSPRLSVKVSIE